MDECRYLTDSRFSIFGGRAQPDETTQSWCVLAKFGRVRDPSNEFLRIPWTQLRMDYSERLCSTMIPHNVYIKCNSKHDYHIHGSGKRFHFICIFIAFSTYLPTPLFTALRSEALSASTGTATYRARVPSGFRHKIRINTPQH